MAKLHLMQEAKPGGQAVVVGLAGISLLALEQKRFSYTDIKGNRRKNTLLSSPTPDYP
jgi:hypothetical protein